MVDRYTKTVLTVIAVALSVIAAKGMIATPASAQFENSCGGITDPCYIDFAGTSGFPVQVVD